MGKIAGHNLIFFKTISHEKCMNNHALLSLYTRIIWKYPLQGVQHILSSNGPSALFLLFVILDESLTLIKCIFFMHIQYFNPDITFWICTSRTAKYNIIQYTVYSVSYLIIYSRSCMVLISIYFRVALVLVSSSIRIYNINML